MKPNSPAQTEVKRDSTSGEQSDGKSDSRPRRQLKHQPASTPNGRCRNVQLSPLWLVLVLGLFSLPWLHLYRRGTEVKRQQAEVSALSDAFFSSIREYPKNHSAAQFDRLAAALGFLPNDSHSLSVAPAVPISADARAQYTAIEPLLSEMLSEQLGQPDNPLPAIAPKIEAYLVTHRAKLLSVQTHLIEQTPPQWEVNIVKMSDANYPFPGLTNVFYTQKLLLALALSHHHNNQQPEMLAALEASWQLNQAIAQRPDLTSQILTSTIADYQSKLLRHIANLSQPQLSLWNQRFSQQSQQQSVVKSIRFDAWIQYEIQQRSLAKINAQSNKLAVFSPVHAFSLANINAVQTARRATEVLGDTNTCDLSQRAMQAQMTTIQAEAANKAATHAATVLAKRWKTAGDRELALELTQQVLWAKAHYQRSGRWPVTAKIASTACTGTDWIREIATDNTLTIRLDAAPVPAPAPPLQASLKAL